MDSTMNETKAFILKLLFSSIVKTTSEIRHLIHTIYGSHFCMLGLCSGEVWWAHSATHPVPGPGGPSRLHRPVGHLKIHPAVKVIMPSVT